MNLAAWNYIGGMILISDIIWIVFYYYYATIKVYNFQGWVTQADKDGIFKKILGVCGFKICNQEKYRYMGILWIRKKKSGYYLKIPQEIVDNSITTKYRIISQSAFHKWRRGEKIHISFGEQYHTEVRAAANITVKNYIATSHQL